jgi:hypothetical protein
LTGTTSTWPTQSIPDEPITATSFSNVAIAVDNLVSGSFTALGSLSTVGVFTPNTAIQAGGVWDHNVGEAWERRTGNYSTSYTYPGYSGSNPQIQRQDAIPNSTENEFYLPTDWKLHTKPIDGEEDVEHEGYYGVNDPTAIVVWPK